MKYKIPKVFLLFNLTSITFRYTKADRMTFNVITNAVTNKSPYMNDCYNFFTLLDLHLITV